MSRYITHVLSKHTGAQVFNKAMKQITAIIHFFQVVIATENINDEKKFLMPFVNTGLEFGS